MTKMSILVIALSILINITNASSGVIDPPSLIATPHILPLRQLREIGVCPSQPSLQCSVGESCCFGGCCRPETPYCFGSSGCITAKGKAYCQVSPNRVALQTVCSSDRSKCCGKRPFDRCSQSTPVYCVDKQGYIPCRSRDGTLRAGVSCKDNTCCANPKRCCKKADGSSSCCSKGSGGPMLVAPLVKGFKGETAIVQTKMRIQVFLMKVSSGSRIAGFRLETAFRVFGSEYPLFDFSSKLISFKAALSRRPILIADKIFSSQNRVPKKVKTITFLNNDSRLDHGICSTLLIAKFSETPTIVRCEREEANGRQKSYIVEVRIFLVKV